MSRILASMRCLPPAMADAASGPATLADTPRLFALGAVGWAAWLAVLMLAGA